MHAWRRGVLLAYLRPSVMIVTMNVRISKEASENKVSQQGAVVVRARTNNKTSCLRHTRSVEVQLLRVCINMKKAYRSVLLSCPLCVAAPTQPHILPQPHPGRGDLRRHQTSFSSHYPTRSSLISGRLIIMSPRNVEINGCLPCHVAVPAQAWTQRAFPSFLTSLVAERRIYARWWLGKGVGGL